MDFSFDDPVLAKVQSRANLFVHGPYGSGKSTLAIERVRWLLRQERVRGDDILVLVPQPLNVRYFAAALRGKNAPPGPPVVVNTHSTMARNAVQLYWPLIAGDAGFADPRREPTFLNVEMAQYHLGALIDEAIARQEFSGVIVRRNRIVVQLLSNFNRAALTGISIDETYNRLLAALGERNEPGQVNALEAARRVSHAFRAFCYRDSLVDFSLHMELFRTQVLVNDWSRTHLLRSHRHLIADNLEEESPAAHDLVRQLAPQLESLLLCVDDDGGYRTFLGAEPESAYELADLCQEVIDLPESHTTSPEMRQVAEAYGMALPNVGIDTPRTPVRANPQAIRSALTMAGSEDAETWRYYPQMVRGVAREVAALALEQEVPPDQIVIVAPIISDSLRFSLQTELAKLGVKSTGHRPSRALEDEPATRALLTLAKLAHPHWNLRPARQDVAQALALSIDALDPVRAALLATMIYPDSSSTIDLRRFGELAPESRRRVTYAAGEAFDQLREWIYGWRAGSATSPRPSPKEREKGNLTLALSKGEGELHLTPALSKREGEAPPHPGPLLKEREKGDSFSDAHENVREMGGPLDQFVARIFEEVLSQPGFGFRENVDHVRVAHQVVDSARRLRWAMEPTVPVGAPLDIGREYVHMIDSGILGAVHLPALRPDADAVLISPVQSFLLRNITVRYQFWLDVGSIDWWVRLFQPLTHPYVLARTWGANRAWLDDDEQAVRAISMRRQTLGLLRRASERVYLALSEYSESGFEQKGPLIKATNRVLTAVE